MAKTLIFGHQKPDTDTVTSAIVLSYLKNQLGENTEPRVLGSINNETKFVLKYFDFKEPKYLNDVRLQIKDVDYVKGCYLNMKDSLYSAYNYMSQSKISTVPVVNEKLKYLGAISLKDITADLIVGDLGSLFTSYDNVLNALNGTQILRFNDELNAKIIVPSYRSTTFKDMVEINENSALIVGDRHSIIEYAIANKATIIILTNGLMLPDGLLSFAKENHVNIISSKYDAITTANLVVLSNYINTKIKSNDIITINENDSLYDVLDIANKNTYSNYPVLNNSGKCLGVFKPSITNNTNPKKVILVDHNEIEQSAIGLDEAEIVEIIDHHKIGNIGTLAPINFRNMPVGCTETILYLMYKENNIEIPKNIAGLMLSGIISDTLLLSSPTTTDIDKMALEELAKIAEIDYQKYAMEMFKAGSNIKGKSISEIIHLDFKKFAVDSQRFGIGQVSTMYPEDIMNRKDEFIRVLNEAADNEDYAVMAILVTDILKNGSYLLYNKKSEHIFKESLEQEIEEGIFLEGIVSRKKQIVPRIMNYIEKK